MTDQDNNTAQEEAPEEGVPQEVADEVNALAAEVKKLEREASRSWKITAVAFAVILIVIAGYLTLGIYRQFVREMAKPENLVGMGFDTADQALRSRGLPGLRDAGFADQVAAQLKERAPQMGEDMLRPRLEALKGQLPDYREQVAGELRARIPDLVERASQRFQQNILPDLRERAIQQASATVQDQLNKVDQQIDQIMNQVIARHKEDLRALQAEGPDQMRALSGKLEQTFEQEMGHILNDIFARVDHAVARAHDEMQLLADRYRTQTLTEEQKLEMDLIRLTLELFTQKARTPEEAGPGLLQQVMDALKMPTEELMRGTQAPPTRAPSAEQPAPRAPAERQSRLEALREALQDPDLREEPKQQIVGQLKEALQEEIDARQKQLQQMQQLQEGATEEVPEAQKKGLQQEIQRVQDQLEKLKAELQELGQPAE